MSQKLLDIAKPPARVDQFTPGILKSPKINTVVGEEMMVAK